jgi:serine/threonine protein phosphatase PrpC
VNGPLRQPGPAGEARWRVSTSGWRVTDAGCTDVGLVRASNEDALVRRPEAGLWAVADGMGGHEDGEWASGVIAEAIAAARIAGDFETDCLAIRESLQAANGAIYRQAAAKQLRMGSTVVTLLLGDERFAVFWVGDSRVYRLRAGGLAQLTTDHTHVQSKVARGLLSPGEARVHPMSHVLTRAVGVEAMLDLADVRGVIEPGDVFLLCSDGLHGVVTNHEIGGLLAGRSPAEACEALLGLSRARGGPDNVTLVAAAVGDLVLG